MHPRPPFYWGVVVIATVLLGAYAYLAYIVVRYGGLSAEFGWDAARRYGTWHVSRIVSQGPADGHLQLGDVVLAINGRTEAGRIGPFFDFSGYEQEIRFARVDPAATSYVVRIAREEMELDTSLTPLVGHESRDLASVNLLNRSQALELLPDGNNSQLPLAEEEWFRCAVRRIRHRRDHGGEPHRRAAFSRSLAGRSGARGASRALPSRRRG